MNHESKALRITEVDCGIGKDKLRAGINSVMRHSRLARVLMMAGSACMLIYVLTALRGVSPAGVRLGGVLFYVGIAALLIGLGLRVTGRRSKGL